jgi:hypothetical protein
LIDTTASRPTSTAPAALRVLRATADLAVLVLVYQGVTAGQMFGQSEAAESLRGLGAIGTHVLTGLAAIAAGLLWFTSRGPLWPTVLAAVVFVVSFVQAYLGDGSTMSVHVPLATVLLVGATWLLVWSLSRPALRASGSSRATRAR